MKYQQSILYKFYAVVTYPSNISNQGVWKPIQKIISSDLAASLTRCVKKKKKKKFRFGQIFRSDFLNKIYVKGVIVY